MVNKITSSRKVKRPFQILAETNEGEFPGSGTFTSIPVKSIEIEKDGEYTPVEQIGVEDLMDIVRGNPHTTVRTVGPMLDTVQLMRLINAANDASPTGTVSESVSGLFSMLRDVGSGLVETFFKLVGMRPKSGTPKFEKGKPHELAIVWSVLDWLAPTTSAPGGVTMQAAFPSGTVLRHTHMGAAAFVWDGDNIPVRSISLNVDRGTEVDDILGQEVGYGQQPYGKTVTATVSMLYVTDDLKTDFEADATKAYTITVNSTGPKTITGNGKLLKPKLPIDAGSKEAVPQEWEIQLLTSTAN